MLKIFYKFKQALIELEFIGSRVDISFHKNGDKKFGLIGLKQVMSISFINYNGGLYIINTHPYENNRYKSLHQISIKS